MITRMLRPSLAAGIAAGLLLVGVLGCFLHLRSSRLRAVTANRNEQVCRSLASRIEQLKRGQRHADLKSRSETELSRKIESAAQSAGLQPSHIVRIHPRDPMRIADSDYKDQSTDVELRPVTLKQLIAFLDTIASDTGIQGSFVWLTAPTQEPSAVSAVEPWNAQMTLTNLIFAPKS